MRKYKYIIGYKHEFNDKKIMFVPTEYYCTDNFFVFVVKFIYFKRKYDYITAEWNKPPV